MRFLTHQALAPLIGFVQDDGNVTESLADPSRSALRSRHKAFPHTSFIHLFSFHEISLNHFASPESLPFRCRRCWRCRGRWSWGSGCGSARWCGCSDSFLGLRFTVSRMGKESSGRSKLTEFMTDHVFANKNGNEFSPVVHANGITHHLGRNR